MLAENRKSLIFCALCVFLLCDLQRLNLLSLTVMFSSIAYFISP
jgi:hypothetical protein